MGHGFSRSAAAIDLKTRLAGRLAPYRSPTPRSYHTVGRRLRRAQSSAPAVRRHWPQNAARREARPTDHRPQGRITR